MFVRIIYLPWNPSTGHESDQAFFGKENRFVPGDVGGGGIPVDSEAKNMFHLSLH